jgi:hypothetical protein
MTIELITAVIAEETAIRLIAIALDVACDGDNVSLFILFKPTHALFLKHIHIHI